MCGIAGFCGAAATRPAGELEATATAMAATLAHRGPDDAGAWADEAAGVALGFRRLAIVDLSASGRQPMASSDGRYVVVFNGEIYNFRALRAELERTGAAFRGGSDTEVLLETIRRHGVPGALARANGMFALALWDRAERALWLARDRLGEKPLYYGWSGGTLLFASELKALRAHPGFRAEVDRDALALLLRHGYVPGPRSIYRGVAKLPPATVLRVGPEGRPSSGPEPYWSLREAVTAARRDPIASAPEAVEAVEACLTDGVGLRMVADVPVGALLSGGVDSSTVVALMRAQSERVRTFTIGFPSTEVDEAPVARAVARHLGTDHTELAVTAADALAVVPRLPQLYDEPFADSSQIPTVLVCALARRSVSVALTGDGGDEVFGGYARYSSFRRLRRSLARLPRPLRSRLGAALGAVPASAWDALASRAGPALPASVHPARLAARVRKLAVALDAEDDRDRYLRLMAAWDDPAAVVEGAGPVAAPADDAWWADLDDDAERAMCVDTLGYLPDDILAKVDRASMAAGLEARVPLLDHRLVELAWRLPLSLKLRDGQGKWVLREVARRHVPPSLLERPKAGFGVPLAEWLRGPLRPWAEDLLCARRLGDAGLAAAPVRARWAEHLARRCDHSAALWPVLVYQSWRDAQATVPSLVASA